jgi:hypothetical protein
MLFSSVTLLPQEPSFRANTRLVQVPVSVTRTGSSFPAEKLRALDFIVKDNGRLRQVTSFAQGGARAAPGAVSRRKFSRSGESGQQPR